MSGGKATPGPWKLETESRSPDGSDLIITDNGGGYTLASCRVGETGLRDVEQAEANAKLIAAAPALADALELARDHIESTLFDTRPSDRPLVLLDRMRSALRAAGRLP